MKKLTATIFATLLTVVSAGVANAEIASKGYVDDINTTLTGELAKKVNDEDLGALAKKNTVSAAEIDANAVTTEKIMDANVTRAKLAGDVTASLDKADAAVQPSAITDMQVKSNLSNSTNAVEADKESEDKYPSVKAAHAIANAAVDGVTGDITSVTEKVTQLESTVGQHTTQIAEKADKADLDAKEDVANKVQTAGFDTAAVAPDADTKYPSVKAVADKLGTKADKSELANYATTEALEGKADKASTLSGYGITDAYTKGEVDGKVSDMLTKTEAGSTYQTIANKSGAATVQEDIASEDKYPTVAGAKKLIDTEIANVTGDISGLEGRMDTAEGEIDTLQSDVALKQNITDNSLETTNKTIPTAINEVNTAAKGAQSAAEAAQSAAEAAQEAADGKMPKPSGECSNPTNKCVLVSAGEGNYTWEVIARGTTEGAQP